MYKVEYPTTTKAQYDNLNIILNELPHEISTEIATTILKKAHIIELGRKIAQLGIEITNKGAPQADKARALLEEITSGRMDGDATLEAVSNDLDDILETVSVSTKWQFNLGRLKEVAYGLGPGLFSVITARVEAGKSTLHTSLCSAPGGFAEQGALVFIYANEEPVPRLQIRSVCAVTGMSFLEVLNKKDEAKAIYDKIKGNLRYYNAKGMSIEDVRRHCKREKPSVVVYDQLDKFSVEGTFARRDEQLSALYIKARNIADECSHAAVAITQASAAVEGKTYISSADLAESRTGKAAECDLLIGIGKIPGHDEASRILNIIKNKISGDHRDIPCLIRAELSRFID